MAQKATPKKSAKKPAAKKAAARPVVATKKPAAKPGKNGDGAAPKAAVKKAAPTPAAKPAKDVKPIKEIKKEIKVEKAPPMPKSDLQYFRNLLLERRREIIGDVGSMESEAFKGGSNLSNMPIHMADVGTDNFEQEFTLGLIESERQTLREIQEALVRIDNGSYGICMGTGKAIPRVRLEAVPWAKYTIEYNRLLDQGKVGNDDGDGAEEESSSSDEDED